MEEGQKRLVVKDYRDCNLHDRMKLLEEDRKSGILRSGLLHVQRFATYTECILGLIHEYALIDYSEGGEGDVVMWARIITADKDVAAFGCIGTYLETRRVDDMTMTQERFWTECLARLQKRYDTVLFFGVEAGEKP